MRPVLFEWRGLRVHAYPAMMYVGTVFGVIVGYDVAARAGLDPTRVCLAILLLLPVALVGARLLFVAYHWRFFHRQPSGILRRADGGAALYGGLLLAIPVSVPLLIALDLEFGGFWDAAAVTILVGMVFTKVGCFLNGCCAGRVTASRLALVLPNTRGVWRRRIPTQLLESGVAAIILLLALATQPHLPFNSALFFGVLAAYAAARIGLEATRESITTIGRWSVNQVLSAGFVVVAFGGLIIGVWG